MTESLNDLKRHVWLALTGTSRKFEATREEVDAIIDALDYVRVIIVWNDIADEMPPNEPVLATGSLGTVTVVMPYHKSGNGVLKWITKWAKLPMPSKTSQEKAA